MGSTLEPTTSSSLYCPPPCLRPIGCILKRQSDVKALFGNLPNQFYMMKHASFAVLWDTITNSSTGLAINCYGHFEVTHNVLMLHVKRLTHIKPKNIVRLVSCDSVHTWSIQYDVNVS